MLSQINEDLYEKDKDGMILISDVINKKIIFIFILKKKKLNQNMFDYSNLNKYIKNNNSLFKKKKVKNNIIININFFFNAVKLFNFITFKKKIIFYFFKKILFNYVYFYIKIKKIKKLLKFNKILIFNIKKEKLFFNFLKNNNNIYTITSGWFLKNSNILEKHKKKDIKITVLIIKLVILVLKKYFNKNYNILINIKGNSKNIEIILKYIKNKINFYNYLLIHNLLIIKKKKFKKKKSIKKNLKKKFKI